MINTQLFMKPAFRKFCSNCGEKKYNLDFVLKKMAKVTMNVLYIMKRRISTITWIMYKEKISF